MALLCLLVVGLAAGAVSQWPMLGGDIRHTGVSSIATVDTNTAPGVLWSNKLASSLQATPAMSPDNDFTIIGTDDGRLVWLDVATGNIDHTLDAVTRTPFRGTPLVVGNTSDDYSVFAANMDGRLYGISRVGGVWQAPWHTPDNSAWGPLVASPIPITIGGTDYVVVASLDGNIYRINPATHAWNIWFTAGGAIESTPALAPVNAAGGNALLAVTLPVGQQHVLVDDIVNFYPGDEIRAVGGANGDEDLGYITKISEETPGVRWRIDFTGTATIQHDQGPAVFVRTTPHRPLIFGCNDGRVYSINADEVNTRVRWVYPDLNTRLQGFLAAPMLTNSYVFIGDRAGTFYMLDIYKGGSSAYYAGADPLVDRRAVGASGVVTTAALANANLIYAGCENNGLLKIDMTALAASPVLINTVPSAVRAQPVVDSNGLLLVTTQSGEVYCLNPDGSLKWTTPALAGRGAAIYSSAVPANHGGNTVILVTTSDGYVICLQDGETGAVPSAGALPNGAWPQHQRGETHPGSMTAAPESFAAPDDLTAAVTGYYDPAKLRWTLNTGRRDWLKTDAVTGANSIRVFNPEFIRKGDRLELQDKTNPGDKHEVVQVTDIAGDMLNISSEATVSHTLKYSYALGSTILALNSGGAVVSSVSVTRNGDTMRSAALAAASTIGNTTLTVTDASELYVGDILLLGAEYLGPITALTRTPTGENDTITVTYAPLLAHNANETVQVSHYRRDKLKADAAAGSDTVQVEHPTRFLVGDRIRIDDEVFTVTRIDGDTLSVTPKLTGAYTLGTLVWAGQPGEWSAYVGADDGYLRALDPDTGGLYWQTSVNQYLNAVRGTPVVDNRLGRVYVTSAAGRLFAFAQNGQFLWAYPGLTAPGLAPISGSPVIDDSGNIFFATQGGFIYKLTPDGTLAVKSTDSTQTCVYPPTPQPPFTVTPLAPIEGGLALYLANPADQDSLRVVFATRIGKVYSLDGNLTKKWVYPDDITALPKPVTGPIAASPVIGADGTIYIGDQAAQGVVHAIYEETATGAVMSRWTATFAGLGPVSVTGAVANGVVYMTDRAGKLHALASVDGARIATVMLDGAAGPLTLDAGGKLLAATAKGSVYCFTPLTADNQLPLWRWNVQNDANRPAGLPMRTAPALWMGDLVMVGSDDGTVYGIGPKSRQWNDVEKPATISSRPSGAWPYFQRDARRQASTGQFAALDAGPLNPTLRWFAEHAKRVQGSPVVTDQTPDRSTRVLTGTDEGKVFAYDASTGAKRWQYDLAGQGPVRSAPAVHTDGSIAVGALDGRLYALKPDGTLKWSTLDTLDDPMTGKLLGNFLASPAVAKDGVIYAATADSLHTTGVYQSNTGSAIAGAPLQDGSVISEVTDKDEIIYKLNELARVMRIHLCTKNGGELYFRKAATDPWTLYGAFPEEGTKRYIHADLDREMGEIRWRNLSTTEVAVQEFEVYTSGSMTAAAMAVPADLVYRDGANAPVTFPYAGTTLVADFTIKPRYIWKVVITTKDAGTLTVRGADGQSYDVRTFTAKANPEKYEVSLHRNIETITWTVPAPTGNRTAADFMVYAEQFTNGGGRVYAFAADTGQVLWQYPAVGQPALPPVIASLAVSSPETASDHLSDIVFVGTSGGQVLALQGADGMKKWEKLTYARVLAAPVLVESTVGTGVLLADDAGKGHLLNAATGAYVSGSWPITLSGSFSNSPAIGVSLTAPSQRISVTANDGELVCAAAPPGLQGGSYNPAISADGRYIAYASQAINLLMPDTTADADVYLYDRLTRAVERVSVATNGTQGDFYSYWPSISGDGRFVAFWSRATNLIASDTNNADDIYVRDRTGNVTVRVSVATDGTQGDGASSFPAMSEDGRFVAFSSAATNLVAGDSNAKEDIFLRDRDTDADGIFDEAGAVSTTRINMGLLGAEADGDCANVSISADGRYIGFSSTATNLVAGDMNAQEDVFIYDRTTGIIERVSVSSAEVEATGRSTRPSLNADGRYVGFYSNAADLVAGDTNGVYDYFVRDRITGTTTRVSVATDGTEANGQSMALLSSLSADGRFVVFWSEASNLVSGDTNGVADIFLHDRVTGTTTRMNTANNGDQANGASGTDGTYTRGVAISADGSFVVYYSVAGNVTPGDMNGVGDLFLRELYGAKAYLVNDAGGLFRIDNLATGAHSTVSVTDQSGKTIEVGGVKSSPMLDSQGRMYFGSDFGVLYCIDPETGVLQWAYSPDRGTIMTTLYENASIGETTFRVGWIDGFRVGDSVRITGPNGEQVEDLGFITGVGTETANTKLTQAAPEVGNESVLHVAAINTTRMRVGDAVYIEAKVNPLTSVPQSRRFIGNMTAMDPIAKTITLDQNVTQIDLDGDGQVDDDYPIDSTVFIGPAYGVLTVSNGLRLARRAGDVIRVSRDNLLPLRTSPSIGPSQTVFIGGDDGILYAVGPIGPAGLPDDLPPLATGGNNSVWWTFHQNNQRTGYANRAGAYYSDYRWYTNTGSTLESSPALGYADSLAPLGLLYVGTTDEFSDNEGRTLRGSIMGMNASSGGIIWRFSDNNTMGRVISSPAVFSVDRTDHTGQTVQDEQAVFGTVELPEARGGRLLGATLKDGTIVPSAAITDINADDEIIALLVNNSTYFSAGMEVYLTKAGSGSNFEICGVVTRKEGNRLYLNEPYTDTNANGKRDVGETYVDQNGNGKYDGPWKAIRDHLLPEVFTDANGNGQYDLGELFVDKDGDNIYDEYLEIVHAQATQQGRIHCVDRTGVQRWKFPPEGATVSERIGPVRSSPVVSKDGTIYFGTDDGVVYAVSSAGALLWSYVVDRRDESEATAEISSSPALDESGGRLFVGVSIPETNKGYLLALNAVTNDADRRKLWMVELAGPVTASPTIAMVDGKERIYIGVDDMESSDAGSGGFYCLNPENGAVLQFMPTDDPIYATAAVTPETNTKSFVIEHIDGTRTVLRLANVAGLQAGMLVKVRATSNTAVRVIDAIDEDANEVTLDLALPAGNAYTTLRTNEQMVIVPTLGGKLLAFSTVGQMPPVFTGTGLNDLAIGPTYTGATPKSYRVEITGTAPDTFRWSDDGGTTWDAAGVAITGADQALNDGITIKFGRTTGHAVGAMWNFRAYPAKLAEINVSAHPIRSSPAVSVEENIDSRGTRGFLVYFGSNNYLFYCYRAIPKYGGYPGGPDPLAFHWSRNLRDRLYGSPVIGMLTTGSTAPEMSITAPTFTGTGSNDLTCDGNYIGTALITYKVVIDSVGTPDTFKWSDDGGATWRAERVPITGATQSLNLGVTLRFTGTTGHAVNDAWTFSIVEEMSINTATFAGTGLNDLTNGGSYTGAAPRVYVVTIDSVGATDTFKWSDNGGLSWRATNVPIANGVMNLNNGVTVQFGAQTGHTLNDAWTFTVDFRKVNGRAVVYQVSRDRYVYAFGDMIGYDGEPIDPDVGPSDDYVPAEEGDQKREPSTVSVTKSVEFAGESYTDQNNNGTYNVGEPFNDLDGDGVYDPIDPSIWRFVVTVRNTGRGLVDQLNIYDAMPPSLCTDVKPTVEASAVTAPIYIPNGAGIVLDDLSSMGTYTGPAPTWFWVRISTSGTPDRFEWSRDGVIWSAAVDMDGNWQDLEDGVRIKFNTTTGHRVGDKWKFSTVKFTVSDEKPWEIRWTTADDTGFTLKPSLGDPRQAKNEYQLTFVFYAPVADDPRTYANLGSRLNMASNATVLASPNAISDIRVPQLSLGEMAYLQVFKHPFPQEIGGSLGRNHIYAKGTTYNNSAPREIETHKETPVQNGWTDTFVVRFYYGGYVDPILKRMSGEGLSEFGVPPVLSQETHEIRAFSPWNHVHPEDGVPLYGLKFTKSMNDNERLQPGNHRMAPTEKSEEGGWATSGIQIPLFPTAKRVDMALRNGSILESTIAPYAWRVSIQQGKAQLNKRIAKWGPEIFCEERVTPATVDGNQNDTTIKVKLVGTPTYVPANPANPQNDLTTGGAATAQRTYQVEIDGVAPDTFKWSDDGGKTWAAVTVAITGADQDLSDGVKIRFGATTGHTLGDSWFFTVAPTLRIEPGHLVTFENADGTRPEGYVQSVNKTALVITLTAAVDVQDGAPVRVEWAPDMVITNPVSVTEQDPSTSNNSTAPWIPMSAFVMGSESAPGYTASTQTVTVLNPSRFFGVPPTWPRFRYLTSPVDLRVAGSYVGRDWNRSLLDPTAAPYYQFGEEPLAGSDWDGFRYDPYLENMLGLDHNILDLPDGTGLRERQSLEMHLTRDVPSHLAQGLFRSYGETLPPSCVYDDVNNNGRWDRGERVYMERNGTPGYNIDDPADVLLAPETFDTRVFMDMNGNLVWDTGEPYYLVSPLETDYASREMPMATVAGNHASATVIAVTPASATAGLRIRKGSWVIFETADGKHPRGYVTAVNTTAGNETITLAQPLSVAAGVAVRVMQHDPLVTELAVPSVVGMQVPETVVDIGAQAGSSSIIVPRRFPSLRNTGNSPINGSDLSLDALTSVMTTDAANGYDLLEQSGELHRTGLAGVIFDGKVVLRPAAERQPLKFEHFFPPSWTLLKSPAGSGHGFTRSFSLPVVVPPGQPTGSYTSAATVHDGAGNGDVTTLSMRVNENRFSQVVAGENTPPIFDARHFAAPADIQGWGWTNYLNGIESWPTTATLPSLGDELGVWVASNTPQTATLPALDTDTNIWFRRVKHLVTRTTALDFTNNIVTIPTGDCAKVRNVNDQTSDLLVLRVRPTVHLPAWTAGMAYPMDAVVTCDGVPYACIQAHTADAANRPNIDQTGKWMQYVWYGRVTGANANTGQVTVTPISTIVWPYDTATTVVEIYSHPWVPVLSSAEITKIRQMLADPGNPTGALPAPLRFTTPTVTFTTENPPMPLLTWSVSAVRRVTRNGQVHHVPVSYLLYRRYDPANPTANTVFWVGAPDMPVRNGEPAPLPQREKPVMLPAVNGLGSMLLYQSAAEGGAGLHYAIGIVNPLATPLTTVRSDATGVTDVSVGSTARLYKGMMVKLGDAHVYARVAAIISPTVVRFTQAVTIVADTILYSTTALASTSGAVTADATGIVDVLVDSTEMLVAEMVVAIDNPTQSDLICRIQAVVNATTVRLSGLQIGNEIEAGAVIKTYWTLDQPLAPINRAFNHAGNARVWADSVNGVAQSIMTAINMVFQAQAADGNTDLYYARLDFRKPESYVDANGNGRYDGGEAYIDANGNGQYDGLTPPYAALLPLTLPEADQNTGIIHEVLTANGDNTLFTGGKYLAWSNGFDADDRLTLIINGDRAHPRELNVTDALREYSLEYVEGGTRYRLAVDPYRGVVRILNGAVTSVEFIGVPRVQRLTSHLAPDVNPVVAVERWRYYRSERFTDNDLDGVYDVGEPFGDENGNAVYDGEEVIPDYGLNETLKSFPRVWIFWTRQHDDNLQSRVYYRTFRMNNTGNAANPEIRCLDTEMREPSQAMVTADSTGTDVTVNSTALFSAGMTVVIDGQPCVIAEVVNGTTLRMTEAVTVSANMPVMSPSAAKAYKQVNIDMPERMLPMEVFGLDGQVWVTKMAASANAPEAGLWVTSTAPRDLFPPYPSSARSLTKYDLFLQVINVPVPD